MGILRADRITGLGGANAITGSVRFNGNQDDLQLAPSSDFNFGTGDYTIEAWVYPTEFGRSQMIFAVHNADGTAAAGKFYFRSTNKFTYWSENAARITSSTTYTESKWYHVALVNNSGTQTIYVDGTSQGTAAYSNGFGRDDFVVHIGRNAANNNQSMNGYISNIRVTKGTALYTSAFTPPTTRLIRRSDTVLLACNSASNVLNEETGKVIQSVRADINNSGPQASKFTPNSPVGFSTTSDVGSQYGSTFDGFGNFSTSTYMVPPGGNTRERNRGRAVFTGGYNAPQTGTTEMEFFNIQSGGLTEEFGNQSINRRFSAGLASATRGVTGGSNGTPSWVTGTMEFVTIANASNTTTFGNMTAAGGMVSAHSNDTRGLFFSVWDASGSGPAHKGHIDYITIATTGNSADFGQLSVSRPEAAGFGSPTRGICAGGYPAADGTTMSNVIDYVTISTLGNATDFGDLTQARQAVSGASSQTRGVVAGGYVYGSPAGTFNINTIDYITIATTGDALDFGDLIVGAMAKSVGNCSDQTRGVFTGGKTAAPTYINTIEIVTIATTGNASDFGDLKRTRAYGSVFCDSHGGLS